MNDQYKSLSIPKDPIVHIMDGRGFYNVIQKNKKNAFILKPNISNRQRRLTFCNHPKDELLSKNPDKQALFFFITNKDDVILGAANLKLKKIKDNIVTFDAVSIDRSARHNGFAKKIISAAFDYCQSHDYTIEASDFEYLGPRYLKNIVPELHSNFPDLFIDYPLGDHPIKGSQDYTFVPVMTSFAPKLLVS